MRQLDCVWFIQGVWYVMLWCREEGNGAAPEADSATRGGAAGAEQVTLDAMSVMSKNKARPTDHLGHESQT